MMRRAQLMCTALGSVGYPGGSSPLVRGWWPPLAPLCQEGTLCHLGKPKGFSHSPASLKGNQ